jgi:hypothetical protein
LTWRELDALAKALRSRIRREDARAGRICQVIAGSMTGKSYPLEDFMPSEEPIAEQPLTDEQMMAKVNTVMAMIGGLMSGERS